MSASDTLRVATWNIHGFLGEGRRPDFERTVRVIERIDADLLALQEVDGRSHLGREPFAFERLRDALGGHLVEARLVGSGGRAYGHVFWSRHPLSEEFVRHLPGPGFEPRAVIDVIVATPIGALRCLAAHFGLRPVARRSQAAFVAGFVRSGEPTIALGDFNEWRRAGAVDRALREVLPGAIQPPTWPARRPLVPMDRLYASADFRIDSAEALREAAPASDHLPLVVTLRRMG